MASKGPEIGEYGHNGRYMAQKWGAMEGYRNLANILQMYQRDATAVMEIDEGLRYGEQGFSQTLQQISLMSSCGRRASDDTVREYTYRMLRYRELK